MNAMREQHHNHVALLSSAKAQSQQVYDQLVSMKQSAANTEDARRAAVASLVRGIFRVNTLFVDHR
jgi:hypothetical protein